MEKQQQPIEADTSNTTNSAPSQEIQNPDWNAVGNLIATALTNAANSGSVEQKNKPNKPDTLARLTLIFTIINMVLVFLVGTVGAYFLSVENQQLQLQSAEILQNEAKARLQLTSLTTPGSPGFEITNLGPATAQNLTIASVIFFLNKNWQTTVKDFNSFRIQTTPAVLFGSPSYSKIGFGPERTIQGNNELLLPVKTLPKNGTLEVRILPP